MRSEQDREERSFEPAWRHTRRGRSEEGWLAPPDADVSTGKKPRAGADARVAC